MIITVDTGGTKTLVTSFLDDGSVANSTKFPTPQDKTEYINQLIDTLKNGGYLDQPIEAVVMAMPGVLEDDIVVRSPRHLQWMPGLNVKESLRGIIGDTPIEILNDATVGGFGAVRLHESTPPLAVYVAIGTGIGTGIVLDGKIDVGLNNSEAGQSVFEYDGAIEEWERFASGSAIFRTYGQYARDITDSEIWKDIADRISRGLLSLVPILQPDVIIFGGGIGAHFDKYKDALNSILDEKLSPVVARPMLVQAKNTEEIVVYGCYYYARDILLANN